MTKFTEVLRTPDGRWVWDEKARTLTHYQKGGRRATVERPLGARANTLDYAVMFAARAEYLYQLAKIEHERDQRRKRRKK